MGVGVKGQKSARADMEERAALKWVKRESIGQR
jgi:hypothetical protein